MAFAMFAVSCSSADVDIVAPGSAPLLIANSGEATPRASGNVNGSDDVSLVDSVDLSANWKSTCRYEYFSSVQKGRGDPMGESAVSIYDGKGRTIYHGLNASIDFERIRNKWQAIQDGSINLKRAPSLDTLSDYAELSTESFVENDIIFVFYKTINCKFCEQNLKGYVNLKDENPDLSLSLFEVDVKFDQDSDKCAV